MAERAARQAEALAKLLVYATQGARVMARNAQAERDLIRTGDCDMAAWDETEEGRRYAAIIESAEAIQAKLKVLTLTAGFNPKAPLTTGRPS